MSKLNIKDIYKTEVVLSESRSGYIRLDLKMIDWPKKIHMGEEVPMCVSFTERQARMLADAIYEMIEDD